MKPSRRVVVLVLLAFALCLSVSPCYAQDSQNSYQALTDKFFELLKQDKGPQGVDLLMGTNPALARVQDQFDQLKTQFGSLKTLMGPYITRTLLVETKVDDIFVYQHYLVAYERQPISVRIKYYKPGTKWVCYGLQFDGEVADLIQKSSDASIRFNVK